MKTGDENDSFMHHARKKMETLPMVSHMDDVESGSKYDFENDFAYRNNVANAPTKIRLAFIRKVYSLLTVQLGASIIIGGVCMFEPHVKGFIQSSPWMVIVSFILSIVTLIALHIYRRDTPTNFILLAAFTVIQAYSVGVVVSFFNISQVLIALGLTFAVVCGLTAYTFQSKRDFTSMGFGLFAAASVLMFGMFINMIVGSTALDFLLSIGGALLFSLFIIYDTKMLMENLSAEEYILATISLYLDIINLFLYILHIVASADRS